MNPDDAINASAARISMVRGSEMRLPRIHTCRQRDCRPLCELDLINDGRLGRGSKIIDNRVYVCIHHQIHVCCSDRCREYLDRPDGVCPITGLYHGQSEGIGGGGGSGGSGYVPPEKRTARFKPGLSVMKRATPVPQEPLTAEEQQLHLYSQPGAKHQRIDNDNVRVKIEPETAASTSQSSQDDGDSSLAPQTIFSNAVAVKSEQQQQRDREGTIGSARTITSTLPESGFYSFGSTVVKKTNKHSKRGLRSGPHGGGGGGGMRKKPVPMQRRRDEAEFIVTQLLYSSTRKAIIKEKKERLANDKLKALLAYYKDRVGVTFPIMVEVEGIKAIYDVDLPTLRDLKRDETRINHYVEIIVRTWDIVTKTPWGAQNPGYKFVAHALSVLYKMRSGMKLNNLQLLPHDSYLFALPIRGDLWRYNEVYNSSIVTEGMKHIRSAYESALAAGWSPSALSVDSI